MGRRLVYTKPLNSAEFQDVVKSKNSPYYFSNFIHVVHPVRGKVPFKLFPYQRAVLREFITHRFNIVLKFRQAGLTELIAMFCLWYAMFHPNKNIVIISIKETVAKKVLRKIKYMYRNLPPHLQVQIVNGKPGEHGTAMEMEFSNGSLISSVPTTEEAGRSEAVSLLVIDEAAIVRWANTIWASAFPTLSTGGRAILNSTPYGVGNFFHKMWVQACSGGVISGPGAASAKLNPIRLYWRMHPERDIQWYNEMRDMLGPRRTAQEIDGDFLTSGHTYFDLADIREIEEQLAEYKRLDIKKDPFFRPLWKISGFGKIVDQLILYDYPKPKLRYTIGSDIATGRARDYSTLTLGDHLGEEYGCFKAKLPINTMADILGALGKMYNWALIAPESNDIGLGVAIKLQEERYRNLYYSTKLVKKKKEKKPKAEEIPGWYTTRKNRPIILAELEEDVRQETAVIKNPFFVQEAYTFIYDSKNKPVAMGKSESAEEDLSDDEEFTDDAIIGQSIYNHLRKVSKPNIVILPR